MNLARHIPDLILPAAIAGGYLVSRHMKGRQPPPSLRASITRDLRDWSGMAALQAAYIALFTGLHAASLLDLTSTLLGSGVAGFYLIIDVSMTIRGLRARRAYNALGPLTYLAEVRHAFGPAATLASTPAAPNLAARLAQNMPEVFGPGSPGNDQ